MKARKNIKNQRQTNKRKIIKHGCVLVNSVIDKLPFELHLPKYQYCGPGTKLAKRLARGDPCINKLDTLCRDHDIAYENHKDSSERHKADKILGAEAMNRVFSRDAKFGERAASLLTGSKKLNCKKSRKNQRNQRNQKILNLRLLIEMSN